MLYRNINVWLLVLILIVLNHTEASKSERKSSPADAPSVSSSSTPPTVNAQAEQDVSIKSQINEEVEEWPIREMIAILGHIKCGTKIVFYRIFF